MNFAFSFFANTSTGARRFRRGRGSGSGQFDTQARQGFFGFLFPISAAETLRGDDVPAARFFVATGFFFNRAEFPCHHRVARTLIKLGKFGWRVWAVLRLADARLNLSPISHGRDCSADIHLGQ